MQPIRLVVVVDNNIANVRSKALEKEGINKDAWDDVLSLSLHANTLLSLEGVQGLTSLMELNVSSNMLTSESLSSSGQCLTGLIHLNSLDMSTNYLEDLKSIPLLPSLTRLIVAHNKIIDISGLERIAGCSLEYLDVHDNCLTEPFSVHVQSLRGLLSLKELIWSPNPCDLSERLPSVAVLLHSRTLPCLESLDGKKVANLESAIHDTTTTTAIKTPGCHSISHFNPNSNSNDLTSGPHSSLTIPATSSKEVSLPRFTAVAKQHLKLLHERQRRNNREIPEVGENNKPHVCPEDGNEGDRLESLEGLATNIRVELLERRLETLEGENLTFVSTPRVVGSRQHPKQQDRKEKKAALIRKRCSTTTTTPDLRTGSSSSSLHSVQGLHTTGELRAASPTYSAVRMKVHSGAQTTLEYSNFMVYAASQAVPDVRDTAVQTVAQATCDAETQDDRRIQTLHCPGSLNLAMKWLSLMSMKCVSWGFSRWKDYAAATLISQKVSSGAIEEILLAMNKEVGDDLRVSTSVCLSPAIEKVIKESIRRVAQTTNSAITDAQSYISTLESSLKEELRYHLELKKVCARESQETAMARSIIEDVNETLKTRELEVSTLKEELSKAHDDMQKMDATMKFELVLLKKQLYRADQERQAQNIIYKTLEEEARDMKEKLKDEQAAKQILLKNTEVELQRQVAKALSAAEVEIYKCHNNAEAKVEAFRSAFHQLVAMTHELKNDLYRVSSEAEVAKKAEEMHKKESRAYQDEVKILSAEIASIVGKERIAEGMEAQCGCEIGVNGLGARESVELLLDEAYQDLQRSEKARERLEAEVKSRDDVLLYVEEEMRSLREARRDEINSLNKQLREVKCAEEVNSYAKQVVDEKLKKLEEDMTLKNEELNVVHATNASLTEDLKLITSDLETTRSDLKAVKLELQTSRDNEMALRVESRRYMAYVQNMECKMKELICAVDGERAIARQKARMAVLASEKLAAVAAETSKRACH